MFTFQSEEQLRGVRLLVISNSDESGDHEEKSIVAPIGGPVTTFDLCVLASTIITRCSSCP